MKLKARYGFVGTSGLVVMVLSGTFMTIYSFYLVTKFMSGLTFEQSVPMLLVLFLGGFLPYVAGVMMFKHGKRILSREK